MRLFVSFGSVISVDIHTLIFKLCAFTITLLLLYVTHIILLLSHKPHTHVHTPTQTPTLSTRTSFLFTDLSINHSQFDFPIIIFIFHPFLNCIKVNFAFFFGIDFVTVNKKYFIRR